MLTVLLNCEVVINSRSITFMSEKNEIIPLTQSRFLQEIKLHYRKSKCNFHSENLSEVPEVSNFKDSRAKENESVYMTKAGRKVVKSE